MIYLLEDDDSIRDFVIYTLKTERHKESEQREKTSFTEPANYQL